MAQHVNGPFRRGSRNTIIDANNINLYPGTSIFFNNFGFIPLERILNTNSYEYSYVVVTEGNIPQSELYRLQVITNYEEDTDSEDDALSEELYYQLKIGEKKYDLENKQNEVIEIPMDSISEELKKIYEDLRYQNEYKCIVCENYLFIYLPYEKEKIDDNIDKVDITMIDFVVVISSASMIDLEYLVKCNIKEIIIIQWNYQHVNTMRIKYCHTTSTKSSNFKI